MTPTKGYYRVIAGAGNAFINECQQAGFIGGDWGIHQDMQPHLSKDWNMFRKLVFPMFFASNPNKSKVAAGLACGMLQTIVSMKIGDVILMPMGSGQYLIGEISAEYKYEPNGVLPHRREINWFGRGINRTEMSPDFRKTLHSSVRVCNLEKFANEIENLLEGHRPPALYHTDENVEDPTVFALEKHLEDFLVTNWSSTELGKEYDIFEDDGELAGQQFNTDTGPIDILAISKDKKTLLVVELKRGRASDTVVGQIQRYMGYVKDILAETDQVVKGVIIALEDDLKLRRALSVTQNIEYYNYQLNFRLQKG